MLTEAPETDPLHARRRGQLVVAATLAVQTLVTMGALAVATVAPEAAASLGVPASTIGYQLSLIYGVAIMTSLSSSALIRRFGACRTSQFAMLAIAAGGMLCGMSSLAFVIAGSLALGLGQGSVNPAASHLLVRHGPTRNRSLIFAIKQTGQPLGGFLAGIVCPPVALWLGWHMAPVTAGLCALVLAVLLQPACRAWDEAPVARRQPEGGTAGPWEGLRLVWVRRDLRLLSASSFCYVFVQLSLTGYMVTILVEERGFDLLTAGFVLSVMQVTGIAGRVIWGWATDRLGDGLLVLCGLGVAMGLAVLGIMTLSPDSPLVLLYGLVVVLGLSAVSWTGIYMAEVARLSPPGAVGAATGAALSVTFIGVLVGPTMFAALQPYAGGYTPTLALLAVMSGLGTLAAIGARRAARHV